MTHASEQSPFLSQWKLVRSAIEHENTLKSHRVTWLLATQLFLFTGFTSIFVEAVKNDHLFRSLRVYAVLFIVFFAGVYVCVLAWASIRAAQKMIARLQNWWLIHCHGTIKDPLSEWILSAKYGKGQTSFPPVNGIFTSKLHLYFDEALLPVALASFWIILFFATTVIFLHRRFGFHPVDSTVILAMAGITLLAMAIVFYRQALKRTSSRNAKELARIIRAKGLACACEEWEIKEILDNPPSE